MNKYTPFKKPGSLAVLIIWILLLWPVAIIYAFLRSWGWEKRQRLKWEEKYDEISRSH